MSRWNAIICFFACVSLLSCASDKVISADFSLKKFLFVYDTLAIDYKSHPCVDTLVSPLASFTNDYSSKLVYVATGDCSVCISSALSFLEEYQELDERPILVLILKSFSSEIFDHYYDQRVANNPVSLPERKALKLFCDEDCLAEDGAYLVISNRVIRHANRDAFQGFTNGSRAAD